MHVEAWEKDWLGPRVFRYMRYEEDDPRTGKYNGGQKLYFWAVSLGAAGPAAVGPADVVSERVPSAACAKLAYLIHDFTFICFVVSLVFHIYLGTAAEPGTFGSMTRGTVTRAWARLHHPALVPRGDGRRSPSLLKRRASPRAFANRAARAESLVDGAPAAAEPLRFAAGLYRAQAGGRRARSSARTRPSP